MPAGVDVTETGAGIVINISQVVQQPDRLVKLSKMIGPIAWKSGVMGAALGALKGLKDTGEAAVTATNFTETNFEDYVERMQWELRELEKAALLILETPDSSNLQTMYIFNLLNEVTRRFITSNDYGTQKITDEPTSGSSFTYVNGKLVPDEEFDKAMIRNFKTCAGFEYFKEEEDY